MTTSVIRGGTVVTAQGRRRADVLVRDGRIATIGVAVETPAGAEIIDADGCYVMPGGVDPHTHMQLPMMGTVVADDFFTGTAAGVAGGTTTILDFVGPEPGEPPLEALAVWRDRAAKSAIDYGFHMTVSWWGEAFSDAMAAIVNEHGIASFKFFLAYKGRLMLPDEDLLAGFSRCRELGALVQVHAENGEMIAYLQQKMLADGVTSPLGHVLSRPSQCEGEATLRAVTMAEILDVPLYVVHVSAAEAAEAIGRARQRGAKVIGETLPGFLAIDDFGLSRRGFRRRRRPRDEPALSAESAPGSDLAGGGGRHTQHHRHRSLLFHKGAKTPRPRQLHQNSQRLRRD